MWHSRGLQQLAAALQPHSGSFNAALQLLPTCHSPLLSTTRSHGVSSSTGRSHQSNGVCWRPRAHAFRVVLPATRCYRDACQDPLICFTGWQVLCGRTHDHNPLCRAGVGAGLAAGVAAAATAAYCVAQCPQVGANRIPHRHGVVESYVDVHSVLLPHPHTCVPLSCAPGC